MNNYWLDEHFDVQLVQRLKDSIILKAETGQHYLCWKEREEIKVRTILNLMQNSDGFDRDYEVQAVKDRAAPLLDPYKCFSERLKNTKFVI